MKLIFILLIALQGIATCHIKTANILPSYNTGSKFIMSGHLPEVGLNNFDLAIARMASATSAHTPLLNRIFVLISGNNLLKGVTLMLAFWWCWFTTYPSKARRSWVHVKLVSGLFASFVAMFIARILVILLPYRARPMNTQGLGIHLPAGASAADIEKLSSFPSDHAVMFFAISTVLFTVNKKTGILAYLYTAIFLTLSRVYLNYHWATDVLAGAAIGVLLTMLIVNLPLVEKLALRLYQFGTKKYPGWFYCLLFFTTYTLSNMFDELRGIIVYIDHLHI